ncbi:Rgp1-domain-containing protein [Radiomyces spectabilis]|uniref:Rgp1-domain-containing protein n=1 Tax=Radiomyces spectabilis TaxID=64574 RepID=UPI0022206EC4|nr:Rgp1-domain-containing protein [Radiomyces spectabilis]KAI8391357.1 Rgp1-domain-containing protein [Radiomyces spectabilis]
MSILVTTTFSQGAVFYAGETLSCVIAFSNPLPKLSKGPSASTSSPSSIHTKRPGTRHQSPPPNTGTSFHHSRSQSVSSVDMSKAPAPQPDMDASLPNEQSKTRSLSSLASSTFAFFTGYPTKEESEVYTAAPTRTSYALQDNEDLKRNHADGTPISIELGSNDTPRSSTEVLHSYQREPYDVSRRSSIDSLASNPYTANQPPSSLNTRRLSYLVKAPSTPPLLKKSEHLLMGFAQVVGHFIVDPTLINNSEFAPLKNRTMYRPQGSGFGGGGGGLMLTKPDQQSQILGARSTPVFSTPPSILFVDLDLAPGETKKFSYKLKLPNDIPPTHRGKSIRFNYYLIIGTQRSNARPGMQPQGQVVQIRFRVLNHVCEDGSRPIYDLMNPVVWYKDEAAIQSFGETDKKPKAPHKPRNKTEDEKERQSFMDYIEELLDKSTENQSSVEEITRRESDAYDERKLDKEQTDDEEENMPGYIYRKTCVQIVSRITNSSRKAMYDLCKNNQRVAQLHLIKTAYRLGEPVMGVLDFDGAALLTYKVSILLESVEVVESSIALRQPQHIARVSRKCHAEFHSFCLYNQRLSFSLPIPSIASPEFQTTGVKLQYHLKFQFVTNIQPPVTEAKPSASSPAAPNIPINTDEKHRHYQCLQDIEVSTFDCQIPIRVYGSPGGADRALYGQPHTFVVS